MSAPPPWLRPLLLLADLFGTTHAATYYVAPPASGGSDNHPGTLAQPYATIQKAATVRRVFRLAIALACAGLGTTVSLAQSVWPSQYKIAPWETSRLTAADVVGPDGIVYPDWTGVGVEGGIPDVNNSTIRAGYAVFNVTSYGAAGDGLTNDDAPVASALSAALAHVAAGATNKAILYFPAGTYLLRNPININRARVVVDGDGPTSTILKLNSGGSSGQALFNFAPASHTNWSYLYATSNLLRGSNTGTFDKNPATNNYSVGSWVRVIASAAPAGSTMRSRYSKPDNFIDYTDAFWHFGRVFIAKVTAINSTSRTLTFDRTFPHDYYTDESPQTMPVFMMEGNGIQDLQIETTSSSVALAPVRFAYTANGWMLNARITKARNWPFLQETVARMEIRDSVFDGTWADINSGSTAYLGWISAMDSLMDNVQANDLRHMGIFQHAMRCVIRNSTFTGKTVQSPQLHGRFPLENLIENTTFNHTNIAGNTRGITAYGIDWANTLRHGPNGPRNVFYNNRVNAGAGVLTLGGASENQIFVYNRIAVTDDNERMPLVWAADRTFDTIFRGNIAQVVSTMPALNLEDPTCTGWEVYDNVIHGSQGSLWAGDSEPALAANNRRLAYATALGTPAPEAASIFAWQKANAASPRLLLFTANRAIPDTGGTTTVRLVRIRSSTTASLTVALSADIAGLSFPSSVTIPAGAASTTFTVTGQNVSNGEKTVVLTATASGLLSDTESIRVLDQDVAQPTWINEKMNTTPTGLPPEWRAARFGRSLGEGSFSFNSGTGVWSISGSGLETFSYEGTLSRSGRYFAYKTINGDGEIRARVTSASGARQVGLLVLDDEAPISELMMVSTTGQVLSSGFNIDSHAQPHQFVAAGTATYPVWLRIKREGTVFTAYRSTVANPAAESDWTTLATVNFYQNNTAADSSDYKSRATLDPVMHFGLFINSGSETTLASATFTGVAHIGTIVPAGPSVPAPTNLAATASGATTINLSWTDNATDETGYQVERRVGSGSWALVAELGANATAHSSTGLLEGATYSFRVRAVRNASVSSWLESAPITLPATTLPTAPTGLLAEGVSPSEITLSWNDNAHNESGYQIERSTTSGSGFTLLSTTGAGATSFIDSGLPEGVRYFYRVRAGNSVGHSAYTAEASAATRLVAPADLDVVEASGTEIRLLWPDSSAAETAYAIERSLSATGPFAEIASTPAGATTFTDTTPATGQTYFYRVLARNAVATSVPSPLASATALSLQPPLFYEPFAHALSPTTVVGRAGSGNGGSGNWLGVDGTAPREQLLSGNLSGPSRLAALGNHLRMSQSSNGSRIALVLDSTTKAATAPAANQSRDFWVSYVVKTSSTLVTNSNSQTPALVLSGADNTQILRLLAQNARKTQYAIAGANLTTVASASGAIAANTTYTYVAKVTVTDTDGNAANGFERIAARLWQYTAASLPPTAEPVTGGINLSATNVTSRVIDRVEIQGANTANPFFFDELRLGSTYSQVALPLPPAAPTNLTFPATTPTSITLQWTDNATNETAYRIQVATTLGGQYADLVSNLPANTTTYTHTGLTPGATYFYRVRALNADGSSDPASGTAATNGGAPAAAPILYEPANYTLDSTNPDPDAGLNGGNGLPATNNGGSPSGTSTGLRGTWGSDIRVVPGLAYANSGGTLATSGGALRRTTGGGWGVAGTDVYRSMATDPFAGHRYTGNNSWLGWNGSASTQLFGSALLRVSAIGATGWMGLVLGSGRNNGTDHNLYLRERGGSWIASDAAGTEITLGPASTSQTAFFVWRFNFTNATAYSVDFWFNPVLGQPLGTPAGSFTYTGLVSGGYFRGFQTRADTADVLTFDELRLGASFADVAPVTVSAANQPPEVLTATATPSSVTGTQAALAATAYDDLGEAALVYTWSTVTAPGAVSFSPNGTNAAKASTATFTAPGTYVLRVTATDAGGLSASRDLTVTVVSTAAAVEVQPQAASVAAGGNLAFTATVRNQFNQVMNPAPAVAWSVSGGGTISSSGVFTSNGTAGAFSATATSGAASGSVFFTVTPPASAPIVYEPFNYTVGSTAPDPDGGVNNGEGLPATNNGGSPAGTSTGLRGAWGPAHAVVPGLSYSNAGGALATRGGAIQPSNATWGDGLINYYRFMTSDPFAAYRTDGANNGSFGADGTTLYASFLMRPNANFGAGTIARVALGVAETNGNLYIGANLSGAASDFRWGIARGSTGALVETTAAAVPEQTALIVLRFTFGAGDLDTVDMWVNPVLGQALGTPHASLAGSNRGNFALTNLNTRPNTANVFAFDEFRLGASLADVTPLASAATYTVSGLVTHHGAGLAGVTLTDGVRSTLSAADGSYALTGVPPGIYTLAATRAGYVFSPSSILVTVADADLSGRSFAALTAFQSWLSGYSLPADGTGAGALSADPDGDGLSNLLEYALGGNPASNASAPAPQTEVADNSLQLVFFRARSDLTYQVEGSSDLSTWSTLATNPGQVGTNVTVPDPVALDSAQPRRFLRLRVTNP